MVYFNAYFAEVSHLHLPYKLLSLFILLKTTSKAAPESNVEASTNVGLSNWSIRFWLLLQITQLPYSTLEQ